jgi:predicted phage terminase large subunit-like protein
MPPSLNEDAEWLRLLEQERLAEARDSLTAFCRAIDIPAAPIHEDDDDEHGHYPQSIAPAEHHLLINSVLERVERREITRVMFMMPPGSAKSTYASVVFPPWFMGRNPRQGIICASYGTTLARKFGRRCRSIVASQKYRDIFQGTALKTDNRSVEDWGLTNDSQYMAGGMLSGITGNRADGLIIDDPIKGRDTADSPAIRDKTWEAYLSDLRTRLKPNGFIVIINTRWHEDDVCGRILPTNYDGESGWIDAKDGEPWYVVSIQAQAERADDPLGRAHGEWLWTDWFTPEHWSRERLVQGERNWASLYQQRPKPAEGSLIKRAWIERYTTPPAEFLRIIQSWDTAYKDSELNDPSVCTTWGETRQGYYLLNVFRKRMDYPSLKTAVSAQAQRFKPYAILVEDKASGQSLIQEMRLHFAEPIIAMDPKGINKTDRLVAVSSLFEGRKVFLPERADWLIDYESELFGFPLSTHDDQVDSTSQALTYLRDSSGRITHASAGTRRAGFEPDSAGAGESTRTPRNRTRGFM